MDDRRDWAIGAFVNAGDPRVAQSMGRDGRGVLGGTIDRGRELMEGLMGRGEKPFDSHRTKILVIA